MKTDAELMEGIAGGSRDAFETLYERHYGNVLRHVERLVRPRDEARDVAQETFLRVWQKGFQWKNRGSAAGWIFSIATNLSLSHLQSRRGRTDRTRDDELSGIADSASEGPEQALFRRERIRMVREHVGQLSEEKRAVLDVWLDEGITLREIAERLELPLGTIKSRMHYASRELRQGMERDREWRET